MDLRAAALTLTLAGALVPAVVRADGEGATSPEAGRRAYTSFCVRCHGLNLAVSGGGAFDLRRFPADDKARFVRSVSQGLRAMPAWQGIVSPQQMEAIWSYIGQVNGWPPAGGATAAGSADATASAPGS